MRDERQLFGTLRLATAIVALALPSVLTAQDPILGVRLQDSARSFFGGTQIVLSAIVSTDTQAKGTVSWELQVGQRTVCRGEQAFEAADAALSATAIRLPLPPVKPGVVIPAVLRVTAHLIGQPKPSAHTVETLYVFPEDPFADRRQWLEDQRIALFDPIGSTEKALREDDVPYGYVRSPSVLEESEAPRMLVVGSGLSFADYPQLGDTLLRLAKRGHTVLCLRPIGGEFPMPGGEEASAPSPPPDLRFAGDNVISELDKRLDCPPWNTQVPTTATHCLPVADRARVLIRLDTQVNGWPWLDARFPNSGRFLISGFPIIESWESGPTPRFLFLRILEWLAERNQKRETEQ